MRRVVIVGGGLGGMAAALALARNDELEVTLFEASDRLGGKAGASFRDSHYEDHGYHIFPPWYVNTCAIIEELGIRANLKDVSKFHQLRLGEYPRFRTLVNFMSFRHALENLRSGSIPFWDLVLYYYSVVDLVSQSYSRRAFLDQISVNGFVRSRFYRTESVSKQYQDLLLKFVSVPSYKVSAMTVRKMLSYWVANAIPMYRILVGNMHTTFIGPWEERLRRLGCKIVTSSRLTKLCVEGGRIVALELQDSESDTRRVEEVDDVVLAMPPGDVTLLLDDKVHQADPDLARLNYLNAEAMASLSLYLDRKIDGLPSEHINLLDSRYALTMIDVSHHWEGFDHTVLNVIASDVQELENVSSDYATTLLVEELKRFLPFLNTAKITRKCFQPHIKEPLVMNEVGAWKFRPRAQTGLPNLYMAGTHCRNDADMTSMEGAVITGLAAANALLQQAGLDGQWEIQQPRSVRRWLFRLLVVAGLPIAAFGKCWLAAREVLTGRE